MKLLTLLAAFMLAAVVIADNTKSLYDIPLKDIDGKDTSLKAYKGKVLLIVNVASKCGFTPQYEGLEAIQKKYEAKGFTVLAFPCNDFRQQEPGTPAEIKEFCSSTYHVTFPLFEKIHVNEKINGKAAEQHPLYAALTGKESPFPGEIKWNFGKFLISRDGKIIKRFETPVKPESKEVESAIEAALAEK